MTRIAVIGAGLSGLVVARSLQRDHDVTVFEKSRGPGGRMATRYEGGYEFDHGAQYFTARSRQFREFLQPLLQGGIVANWRAHFAELDRSEIATTRDWTAEHPHYVGAPRMNEIGKALAEGLDVYGNTAVAKIAGEPGDWRLHNVDGNPLGRFGWIVFAMPAAQTAALAPPVSADLQRRCDATRMHACIAVMLGFARPLSLQWQAALVRSADISWVSVNSSKPGRPEPATLVVHSTNAYADKQVDEDISIVTSHLLAEIAEVVGVDGQAAEVCRLHRWRYANVDSQEGDTFLLDEASHLAACGDWFRQGRVEAAFLSGFALAQKLNKQLRQ